MITSTPCSWTPGRRNVDAILVDTGTTLPATLTTIEGKIDTVDGVVDAILVDTGTTIPATLTTITSKIDVIDGIVDAILVDTGTTLPASIAVIDGIVDAILLDTNELQTNQGNWVTAVGFSTHSVNDVTGGTTVAAAVTSIKGADGDDLKSISDQLDDKTGYKLASDGLDTISTTSPTGVASNFREMIVQLWRRFFKKSVMDRNALTLKTYADNGTTVITTQDISDDGTTSNQGAAS
jgi:hypothetical protein